jgi:hypothetical protein
VWRERIACENRHVSLQRRRRPILIVGADEDICVRVAGACADRNLHHVIKRDGTHYEDAWAVFDCDAFGKELDNIGDALDMVIDAHPAA